MKQSEGKSKRNSLMELSKEESQRNSLMKQSEGKAKAKTTNQQLTPGICKTVALDEYSIIIGLWVDLQTIVHPQSKNLP